MLLRVVIFNELAGAIQRQMMWRNIFLISFIDADAELQI